MKLSLEKIKLATARKQMNFSDVLKQAHVSTLTATRIREGRDVNTRTAGKIAAALGVDVAELLAS